MPAERRNSSSVGSGMKLWQRCIIYTFIVIYGVIPAVVYFFPCMMSFIAFSFSVPYLYGDLKDPSSVGLELARHMDLYTSTGDTLGLWHILPKSIVDKKEKVPVEEFDSRLASGAPIFIYAHGSGNCRAQVNRVRMYKALREQNWHVIAFDYRGFGDSSGQSNETNMIEDTVTVYRWVKKHAGSSPVFLWGHSLGTGVVARTARVLSSEGQPPDGIVLEGGFNNFHDLIGTTFVTRPYQLFPFIMRIFQDAMKLESVLFTSDEHLNHVRCPVFILHAEDDRTVPVDLGYKLFNSVKSTEQNGGPPVTMHVVPAEKRCGHNHVHQDPDFGSVVRNFVQDSLEFKSRD